MQLRQSLSVLALPLADIHSLIEQELENNPFLEESSAPKSSLLSKERQKKQDLEFRLSLVVQKATLQDVLLRQLSMFCANDEEFKIGCEIIGNIDDNGYLKARLEEIVSAQKTCLEKVENLLKLIQQFEPAGVAARTVSECLLIQLEIGNDKDPLTRKIISQYLDEVARKNYSLIAKNLKEPVEAIRAQVKKILKLDPKPGRNYSPEEAQRIIPDIIIDDKSGELKITINNEDIPDLKLNETYRLMLKDTGLDTRTKEFLAQKLRNATELLRAISKRQTTLRSIVEVLAQIQQEALTEGLAHLKPLTFSDVAQKIDMHETTVCRAVMNKYAKTPYGIIALKDLFSSRLSNQRGEAVSSNHARRLIKELIEQEDKKHPISDQDITVILNKDKNLNISRRTVAKYREEMRILASAYRKER